MSKKTKTACKRRKYQRYQTRKISRNRKNNNRRTRTIRRGGLPPLPTNPPANFDYEESFIQGTYAYSAETSALLAELASAAIELNIYLLNPMSLLTNTVNSSRPEVLDDPEFRANIVHIIANIKESTEICKKNAQNRELSAREREELEAEVERQRRRFAADQAKAIHTYSAETSALLDELANAAIEMKIYLVDPMSMLVKKSKSLRPEYLDGPEFRANIVHIIANIKESTEICKKNAQNQELSAGERERFLRDPLRNGVTTFEDLEAEVERQRRRFAAARLQ